MCFTQKCNLKPKRGTNKRRFNELNYVSFLCSGTGCAPTTCMGTEGYARPGFFHRVLPVFQTEPNKGVAFEAVILIILSFYVWQYNMLNCLGQPLHKAENQGRLQLEAFYIRASKESFFFYIPKCYTMIKNF